MANCGKKTILILVNLLLFCVGAVCIAAGIYAQHYNVNYSEVVPKSANLIAIIVGGCIVLTALFGIVGTCKSDTGGGKCLLFIYGTILLICLLAMVIAAWLLLVWIGRLNDVKQKTVSAQTKKYEQKIEDFVKARWTDCCAHSNDTACSWIPASVLNNATCADYPLFKTKLIDYITDHMKDVTIAFIIAGVFQLVVLLSSCCLMCSKSEDEQEMAGKYHSLGSGGPRVHGTNRVY